eukprot:TRINITY_DN52780_c0_g1_i1.p1 TRINITY_DN52780_c0_g1~~TRINITY_DN52780_c0_g1_i1.p1  ORF type:complete len:365 (+),score=49.16 TRINITY_DN52780_c0_g1_i1:74-1168(+)
MLWRSPETLAECLLLQVVIRCSACSARHLAICLYGKVGNLRTHARDHDSDPSILPMAYMSQRRHLVEANQRHGMRVSFFVHTPDVHLKHEIEALYKPAASLYATDSKQDIHVFQDATLEVRKIEEKLKAMAESMRLSVGLMSQHHVRFDAAVAMRFDLVFYRDLRIPVQKDLERGIWMPSWCDVRSMDSERYGPARDDNQCGRIHAPVLSARGVPDYLFFSTSDHISELSKWGLAIDEIHDSYRTKFGVRAARHMVLGGGHTVIKTYVEERLLLPTIYFKDLIETIDFMTAKVVGRCRVEVDWRAPRINVGKACRSFILDGRCPSILHYNDSFAAFVCPLEGRKACLGPAAKQGETCTWSRVIR